MAESQRVSEKFKAQTQARTITALTFLALVYAYFFLPTSVLSFFEARLKTVGGALGVGLVGALGGVLGSVLSAQDLLATGKSRANGFFRKQYPSEAIKKHYGCRQDQANSLWFKIFNPWENIDALKEDYARTFQRGSDCRLIFVLQWSFVMFFFVSAITWGAIFLWHAWGSTQPVSAEANGATIARVLVLAISLVIAIGLFYQNRLAGPTGCWFRWKEINDIQNIWLNEELFTQAKTYDEAVGKLADATWRHARGYP
jgi:hypothetical protein